MRGFKREKGVSNIVTTVLTIAITVMLFTSAFFFVSSNMPTVTRSNVSSFSSSYSFTDAGSGRAYLMVSLKNLYGQDLPTASTSFNIVVSGPVSFAYSHPLSAFVSGPYLKVNQSFVYNSQVDRETIPASAEGSLSVLVTLVDENAHRIIWYSSLSGAQSSGNLQIASFQPVTVSVGAPVNLTAVAGGGDPPYTYSWSYTGPGGWFTNTNGPTTTFYPSKPGTYTVSAIVRDSFSATSSKYITYSTGSVGPRAIVRSITLNVVNSSGIYAPHLMVQLYGPQPLYNNGVYSITFYGYVDMPPENGYNHLPYGIPVEFTVSLDGIKSQPSIYSVIFNVQNGTHYFTVQNLTNVPGIMNNYRLNFDAMPWSGKIIVSGKPVTQYILFHDQYYNGDNKNNQPAGWILQFTTANATYNLFAPYSYQYGNIHYGAYGSGGSDVFAYTESDSYDSSSGSQIYLGSFSVSSPIIYVQKGAQISLNVLGFAFNPPWWEWGWLAKNQASVTVSWASGSTIYNNQALSEISTVDYPYFYGARFPVQDSASTNIYAGNLPSFTGGNGTLAITIEIDPEKTTSYVFTVVVPVKIPPKKPTPTYTTLTFYPYQNNEYFLEQDAWWKVTLKDMSNGTVMTKSNSWNQPISFNVIVGHSYTYTIPNVNARYDDYKYFSSNVSGRSIYIDSNDPVNVIAYFQLYIGVTADVNPSGAGMVYSTDGQISTSGSQRYYYYVPGYWVLTSSGTLLDYHNYPTITLNERPVNSSYIFTKWTTDNAKFPSSNSTSYTFTLIYSSLTITANYQSTTSSPTYTVWVIPTSSAGIPPGFSWSIKKYIEVNNRTHTITYSSLSNGTIKITSQGSSEDDYYVSRPVTNNYYYNPLSAWVPSTYSNELQVLYNSNDNSSKTPLDFYLVIKGSGQVMVNFDPYFVVNAVAVGQGSVNSAPWGATNYIFYKSNYYIHYNQVLGLVATPNQGMMFLNWSYQNLFTGQYTYNVSTSTNYHPAVLGPTKYVAYFSSPSVTFKESNVASGVTWSVVLGGVYSKVAPNSINVPVSAGTYNVYIPQIVSSYSMFNPTSASVVSGSLSILSSNVLSNYTLVLQLSVSGSGTVNVVYQPYYAVLVSSVGAGSVNSPPFNSNSYVLYNNTYYFQNSTGLSLTATPLPGASFLWWNETQPGNINSVIVSKYSTSPSITVTVTQPIEYVAYFTSIPHITLVPRNLPMVKWCVYYNATNSNYYSSGSGNNSITIPLKSSTGTFIVFPVNYTYSVFVPQNATTQYTQNSLQLSIYVGRNTPSTVYISFLGYYQVMVSPASQITPDPTTASIYSSNYIQYNGYYYYANNTLTSSSITYNGNGFSHWVVKPLLSFASARLSTTNAPTTSITSLTGPVKLIANTTQTVGSTFTAYGYAEYGYSISYPTLVYPDAIYQSYTWIISNTSQINTASGMFQFTPWDSPITYTVTIVLYGNNGGSSTLLGKYIITVYPALTLQTYASRTTVTISPTEFVASFSQPLPSNYVVRLDLGVFNAGQVTMTPMPGSNGYTWFCYAFLPYSGMKSGYASVPLMVYDSSGKLVYSTTVQVQYTMF